MRHLTCLLAVLAVHAGAAAAAPVDRLVFGDSLSDPFVPDLVGVTPAAQFTNGNTWAVQIGLDSAAAGNFARGGAVALSDGDPSTDQDFAGQIAAFGRSGLDIDSDTLAYVWFGGNDAADAVREALPVSLTGGSPAEVAAAISARITPAIGDLQRGLTSLLGLGIDRFALFESPDIGITPLIRSLGAGSLGSLASASFNTGLRDVATELSETADVTVIDTNALYAPILADPEAYGLSNVDDPCLVDLDALFACTGYAFFDPFHPTERIHEIFADAALRADEEPAPVPLPAGGTLLIIGLGAFGLIAGAQGRLTPGRGRNRPSPGPKNAVSGPS